jgi:predicted trehalose synthase
MDAPDKEKTQYLRHMLVMATGYLGSCAELHGATSEDLAGQFTVNRAIEKAQEISRLRDDIADLEATASTLGRKVASLDKTLAGERKKHLDLVSDPLWKLTAPLRRLRSSARRATEDENAP